MPFKTHAVLLGELERLGRDTRANAKLAERIRHKFKIKNTTGYSLNALVDFEDPIDILLHLMIGSEGTLGFISRITYNTVVEDPFKASALVFSRTFAAPAKRSSASSRSRCRPSNCSTARPCTRSKTSPACRRSCASWAKRRRPADRSSICYGRRDK
jgi:FAD/FMN-containing dehydrogenase